MGRRQQRRFMPISESCVPAGRAPRTGGSGSEKRKRRHGKDFSEGKDSAAQSASDTAPRDAGLRDALALQFGNRADHGADQRDLFAGATGRRRAAGSSAGMAGTGDTDAGS